MPLHVCPSMFDRFICFIHLFRFIRFERMQWKIDCCLCVVPLWKKKLKLYEKNDSKEEEKKQDKWKTKHFNICIIWTLINLNTIMWIIFERWSWAYTITFRYDDAVAHVFIKEYKNTPTKRSYIPSVYFFCLLVRVRRVSIKMC